MGTALKLAVIHDSRKPDPPSRELLKAIENRGLTPSFLRISGLSSLIDSTGFIFYGKKRLSDIRGAIVRSLGATINLEQYVRRLTLLREMEGQGVAIMNPVDGIAKARDKYTLLNILARSGIPVPRTFVTEDVGLAYEFVSRVGKAVVKPLMGSRGYGSVFVDNPEVALRIFKTLASFNQVLYVQEYVDKGPYDIRVFVVDGAVIASIQRFTRPGEWRTNIAQGGRAKAYNPPEEVKELAIKACNALGLWYAGVDIAKNDDKGYVLFEVNIAPDWQGLVEATNVRPAEVIVDTLIKHCKR